MKILSLKFSKMREETRDKQGLNMGLKELCNFMIPMSLTEQD